MAFKLNNSPFKYKGGPGDPEGLPSESVKEVKKGLKAGMGSTSSTIIDPYANRNVRSSTMPLGVGSFGFTSNEKSSVDDSKSLSKIREKLLTSNFVRKHPNLRDRIAGSYDKKRKQSSGGGYSSKYIKSTPYSRYRETLKDYRTDIKELPLFSKERRSLRKDTYGKYDERGRRLSLKNKAQLKYKAEGGRFRDFYIPLMPEEKKFKGFRRGATDYSARNPNAGRNQSFCTASDKNCNQVRN